MESRRFKRRVGDAAAAPPGTANPLVMSEAEFRAFQRRKAEAKAAVDAERERAEDVARRRERENRARAAAATKSQQLLKKRIEATKAHVSRGWLIAAACE